MIVICSAVLIGIWWLKIPNSPLTEISLILTCVPFFLSTNNSGHVSLFHSLKLSRRDRVGLEWLIAWDQYKSFRLRYRVGESFWFFQLLGIEKGANLLVTSTSLFTPTLVGHASLIHQLSNFSPALGAVELPARIDFFGEGCLSRASSRAISGGWRKGKGSSCFL